MNPKYELYSSHIICLHYSDRKKLVKVNTDKRQIIKEWITTKTIIGGLDSDTRCVFINGNHGHETVKTIICYYLCVKSDNTLSYEFTTNRKKIVEDVPRTHLM